MSEQSRSAPSMPQASPGSLAPATGQQALVTALRDLIWRVDHVRSLMAGAADEAARQELIALLDTSDARAALGLERSGPFQGSEKDI